MGDCYCFRCKKYFHHLGIARHRAMHRDRGEDCSIRYSTGRIGVYKFSSEYYGDDKNEPQISN